jgi:hypothetical protein
MDNIIPIPKGESSDDHQGTTTTTTTVDWRGRPTNPNNHGGTRAAAFVLGIIYIF